MTVSARRREWVIQTRLGDLEASCSLPQTIAASRGVSDLDAFMCPSFARSMPDPLKFLGMGEAIERVRDHILSGKRIVIYGDYDVDGATSTAVIGRFFRMIGYHHWSFYIPDRMTEGYGPNSRAIETLRDQGHDLLLVVDSGSTAFDPLTVAANVGFETIIIDHHATEAEHPPGILINPKRNDEGGDHTYLCTAGLAFLFVIALNRSLRDAGRYEQSGAAEPNIQSLLGIVALGTVADVVPLVGLNRDLVKIGLGYARQTPGLRALMDVNAIAGAPSAKDCGFLLGPFINAAGRISDTRLGAKLLLTDDEAEADALAYRLQKVNDERKEMQNLAVQDAEHMALAVQGNCAVLYDPSWHPGIVGLIASRIKDRLDKTTIVIGQDGKGSARAMDGFDVGQAIIDARKAGLLIAGGGHAAAGGLTIDPNRLQEFREFMEARLKGFAPAPLQADLSLTPEQATISLVRELSIMEPYGAGNPEPRVVVEGGVIEETRILKGKHIKARIGSIDIIIWNGATSEAGLMLQASVGKQTDVYGKLGVNVFRGNETVVLYAEDVREKTMPASAAA